MTEAPTKYRVRVGLWSPADWAAMRPKQREHAQHQEIAWARGALVRAGADPATLCVGPWQEDASGVWAVATGEGP